MGGFAWSLGRMSVISSVSILHDFNSRMSLFWTAENNLYSTPYIRIINECCIYFGIQGRVTRIWTDVSWFSTLNIEVILFSETSVHIRTK
jgi:hypothetical protein